MTIREHLARAFPLHFQRICEAMHEQHPNNAEVMLDLEPLNSSDPCLGMVFVWTASVEGHDYWSALAYRSQA